MMMDPAAAHKSVPARLKGFLSRPSSVFLVFFVIYLITWPGHYTTGDGAIKVDWARGLLFRGSSKLDPVIGGKLEYSFFPVGHTILAIPSLLASKLVKDVTGVRCEAVLYTILFVLNGAFFLYLVARYLWPIYGARRSWPTVAILGLATIWWPYTKLDFTDPIFVTVLFGAFILLRSGNVGLGILLAGFAWNLRAEGLLYIGVLGLWHLLRSRRLGDIPIMALALVPAVALNSFGNWLRWDTWAVVVRSATYNQPLFDHPFLSGMFGLLLSPGKGAFWFTPPLLLGLMGWNRFRNREATRADAWLFASLFAVSVVLYSRFTFWNGDDAWGPRYMICAVMVMTIPVIEILSRRVLVTTLFVLGMAVQSLAVVLPPLEYVMMVREASGNRPMLFGVPGTNAVDLEEMWYHPHYGQLPGHWTLLRVLVGHPPSRRSGPLTGGAGLPLYDCFPVEVWQRHATPDFIWWRLVPGRSGVVSPAVPKQ